MSTLLLRLAGPFQAWGSSSRFNVRASEREPTKSGVVGLIAAAMGRRREDPIEDLLDIKFGVRIDQVGKIMRDFHTAHSDETGQSFISHRYYLQDAIFLAGIEGNDLLLDTIDEALKKPMFPLYLGRRSCPPTGQITLGIREGLGLLETLKSPEAAPWQAGIWYQKKQGKEVYLELVTDAEPSDKGAFLRGDNPISFDQSYRRYGYRNIVSGINAVLIENPFGKDIHDPMEVF